MLNCPFHDVNTAVPCHISPKEYKLFSYTNTSIIKIFCMCPVPLRAREFLLFMLGPAVVALSCQMYDRKQLMKENLLELGTAIGVSSVGGIFGTAFMVNALQISKVCTVA